VSELTARLLGILERSHGYERSTNATKQEAPYRVDTTGMFKDRTEELQVSQSFFKKGDLEKWFYLPASVRISSHVSWITPNLQIGTNMMAVGSDDLNVTILYLADKID
jgi:hypothetical protein